MTTVGTCRYLGAALALLVVLPALPAWGQVRIPRQSDWTDRGTILTPGPAGSWEVRLNGMITPCTVAKKNGTYYLYYLGADGNRSTDGGPRHRALGVATSTDGINFTKFGGNPIHTYLPNNNEEEGIFSGASTIDANGDILLHYAAMDAGNSTSTSVDSDGRAARTSNGTSLTDLGVDVLSSRNNSLWGSGDELFPVGSFRNGSTWYLYYIAKGNGAFWDLGLAWGSSPTNMPNSQSVITSGSYIIGGCDPVFLDANTIALFVLRDFNTRTIEVRTASVSSPASLSSPVETYNFSDVSHNTVFLDQAAGTWFMYYINRAGDRIGVMTAPVGSSGNSPPSVSLLNPPDGATFTEPASITIDATASDTDGTILQVEFLVDGSVVGADTTSPYSYTWTNVVSGSYSLTVRATDNQGASTSSSAVGVTVTAPPVGPAPPSNLSATAVSPSQIDLAWQDNSSDETGFKIERATGTGSLTVTVKTYNGANTAPTVEAAGSADSFQAGALVVNDRPDAWTAVPAALSGTTRLLTARNDRQQSPIGSKYVVTVSAPCVIYLALDPRYGGTPTSWMATQGGWTDSGMTCDSSALTGWTIWQKSILSGGDVTLGCDEAVRDGVCYAFVGGGNFTEIAQVGANVTSYSDTGLSPGTTYVYRVRSTNATGDSASSNTAGATTQMSGPDADGDGLPDAWEQQYFGNLSQTAGSDADGDGLSNLQEYNAGTNPTLGDSDADGLSDAEEALTYGTNPLVADTDGDGTDDGTEVANGTDPLDPLSYPGSGGGSGGGGSGGGGSGGGCGATGAEILILLGLLRLRRRRG